MTDFKAAKDKLLLRLMKAGDCSYKTYDDFITQRIIEPRRIMHNKNKNSLSVYHKFNSKAWMTSDLFTTWFTDYFQPTVEDYCREKKIPFKILLLADSIPRFPRGLIDINIDFLPVNRTSLLQSMESRSNHSIQVLLSKNFC